MLKKIKVLSINEDVQISSGYSCYSRGILTELNKNPNFEVAEMALFYNPIMHDKTKDKWKVIPCLPKELLKLNGKNDSPELLEGWQKWNQSIVNPLGRTLLEDILLEYQPDTILINNDEFNVKFIFDSPYRRFFNIVWLAACDGIPQNDSWIETMSNSDGLLTYSEWGKNAIENQCPKVKVHGFAPPAGQESFQILNKALVREEFGLNNDVKIVGTVMRNQRRKRFPELFRSFKKYLEQTRDENTYLYCHTRYPDGAFRIPELIQEFGIANRVLFTYSCLNCGHVFCSKYQDLAECPKCRQISAQMPGTANGVSSENLCKIYNLFDLYVQYSNCLTKGQRVLMIDGWKNIEDVKIGDMALTHKGRYRKVVNTFIKENNNVVYEISVYSDDKKLQLTKEHPVLAYSAHNIDKKNHRSFREYLSSKLNKIKPEFVEAKNLRVGDIICSSRVTEFAGPDKIDIIDEYDGDLTDYIITDTTYNHKNSPRAIWSREIIIDNDFCVFLGIFAADGSASCKRKISVTLHNDEKDEIEFVDRILSRFGNTVRYPYKDRNATEIYISNFLLADLMSKWFSKGENKKLPEWVLTLPIEKQKSVVRGWCIGDGHYSYNNYTVSVTISKTLVSQIKQLCKNAGVRYRMITQKKGGNRKDQGRFEFYGNVKNDGFTDVKNNTRGFITQEYYCYQIKDIKEIEYSGNVYNFEVEEDNSYTTEICSVHNSEGFALPLVECASCGVHSCCVNYSAMKDSIKFLDSEPIRVAGLYREMETGVDRAVPDDDHFIELLTKFLSKPKSVRNSMGIRARLAFEKNFGWEQTGEVWANTILNSYREKQPWNSPIVFFEPKPLTEKELHGMSNIEFVRWLLVEVACKPDKVGTYYENEIIRNLNYNCRANMVTNGGNQFYNREIAYSEHKQMGEVFRVREIQRGRYLGLI